MAFSGYTALCT